MSICINHNCAVGKRLLTSTEGGDKALTSKGNRLLSSNTQMVKQLEIQQSFVSNKFKNNYYNTKIAIIAVKSS